MHISPISFFQLTNILCSNCIHICMFCTYIHKDRVYWSLSNGWIFMLNCKADQSSRVYALSTDHHSTCIHNITDISCICWNSMQSMATQCSSILSSSHNWYRMHILRTMQHYYGLPYMPILRLLCFHVYLVCYIIYALHFYCEKLNCHAHEHL